MAEKMSVKELPRKDPLGLIAPPLRSA